MSRGRGIWSRWICNVHLLQHLQEMLALAVDEQNLLAARRKRASSQPPRISSNSSCSIGALLHVHDFGTACADTEMFKETTCKGRLQHQAPSMLLKSELKFLNLVGFQIHAGSV